MKSVIMLICGLLACAAGAFPLNPSFTPEAVAAYKAKADAGEGVRMDLEEAASWYHKAAEQGDVRAGLRLVDAG